MYLVIKIMHMKKSIRMKIIKKQFNAKTVEFIPKKKGIWRAVYEVQWALGIVYKISEYTKLSRISKS